MKAIEDSAPSPPPILSFVLFPCSVRLSLLSERLEHASAVAPQTLSSVFSITGRAHRSRFLVLVWHPSLKNLRRKWRGCEQIILSGLSQEGVERLLKMGQFQTGSLHFITTKPPEKINEFSNAKFST